MSVYPKRFTHSKTPSFSHSRRRQRHDFGRNWNKLKIHNVSELCTVFSEYISLVYFVFVSSCCGKTTERWENNRGFICVKSHFISFKYIHVYIYIYEGISLMSHLCSSSILIKLCGSVILPSISTNWKKVNTFQIQNVPFSLELEFRIDSLYVSKIYNKLVNLIITYSVQNKLRLGGEGMGLSHCQFQNVILTTFKIRSITKVIYNRQTNCHNYYVKSLI